MSKVLFLLDSSGYLVFSILLFFHQAPNLSFAILVEYSIYRTVLMVLSKLVFGGIHPFSSDYIGGTLEHLMRMHGCSVS